MRKVVFKILIVACKVFISNTALGSSAWSKSYLMESQGNYKQASEALLPKIQNSVKSEFALLRYAWLKYMEGDFNSSIQHYKDAISYNPNSLDARLGIMLPLMAQGRWREATLYGEQIISIAPWQYYAHVRIMACEAAQLLWHKLEKHAQLVNERYPSDVTVLLYLARAKSNLNKSKEAVAIYKKALEVVPSNTEALQYVVDNSE